MTRKERLFSLARRCSQEHIFRWLDALSEKGRESLLSQAEMIDFDLVAHLVGRVKKANRRAPAALDPAPVIAAPQPGADESRVEKARKIGLDALTAGRAAGLLVAGGQATRLRFELAKGMHPTGPVSGKCLFQVHAEKVLALSRRHKVRIPLYVMTSEITDTVTRAFFECHQWFGLPEKDVVFFKQGVMPAVDLEGRILLEGRDRIALSPDGHGGCIPAMKRTGVLDDMRRRGIEEIFFFHVDNPLVKILDPLFLGYHVQARAEMSGKVVQKRDPEERVGIVGRAGQRLRVVEYMDLSDEDKQARNGDGSLRYSAAVIGVYLLNVAFVERMAGINGTGDPLVPCHLSRKCVPHIDLHGHLVNPTDSNGIKFETFVFDALPFAERAMMMEVRREDEFAPIKNKEGEDSPGTALAMICDFYAGWLRRAGVALRSDEMGRVAVPVEISPLFALDEEELRRRIKGRKIDGGKPVYLG